MSNCNLTGLKCPEPMMMLRRKIRQMNSGDEILVTADDPSTTRDFPKFCEFQDHTMVKMDIQKTPYEYTIRKG